MRITFVSPYYHPAMIGGIEWYLYHITRLLASRGHEVSIFTTDGGIPHSSLPPQDRLDGVRIERFPTIIDASYRLKVWPGLMKALNEAETDILHVFDYAQFQNLSVRLMSSRDWKTVSTIYDIHSQIPRSSHKAMLMRIFDEYGAKWSLSGYEGILVRTPIQARFVAEMGIDESRIHLTPPGVSPDDFHRPSEDQMERARRIYAPEDESVILYVGRLHPIKGIDVLIEATERIISSGQDVKTLLVGPDGNGYVNTLKRKAHDLGIGSSVVFKGYVEEEEKRMLQSLCDLSVLPSSFEGFGQSLVQAMAKGTPVIGTSVGGIPWLLEDGESGLLVEYGSVGQLSEAIARILCDSHLSKRYAKRGKRRALDFAYPNLVEDLEAIYREVLSSA